MNLFNSIRSWGAQTVSPARCAHCLQFIPISTIFCVRCTQRIMPVVSVTLAVTPSIAMKVVAVSAYELPLSQLINAKGFSDIVASHQLGQLIWERTTMRHMQADLLVPVPLHWTRYAYRGYNQAYEMAKVIKCYSNIPVVELVGRVRRTPFQFTLNPDERAQNVKQAFYLKRNAHEYKNKHIILVDDVMTTGATLQAVAKTLLPLKPASLTAVVACRVNPT